MTFSVADKLSNMDTVIDDFLLLDNLPKGD